MVKDNCEENPTTIITPNTDTYHIIQISRWFWNFNSSHYYSNFKLMNTTTCFLHTKRWTLIIKTNQFKQLDLSLLISGFAIK